MTLIAIKIFISIAMVLGLVFVSEKSPKLGGLLSGLPLSVGIVMFFYAYQEGVAFSVHVVPYGIAGLASMLAFGVGFHLGAKLFFNYRFLNTLSATVSGLLAYSFVGFLLTLFQINLIIAIMIFLFSMPIAIIFFHNVPKVSGAVTLKNGFAALAFRAVFATVVILSITGMSSILGEKWGGILASFPTMIGSVLIILVYSTKNGIYPNVLKHFSYGISILALYYLLVLWLYPSIGLGFGTLLAYMICFIYLYLLSQIGLLGKFVRVR